MPLVGRMLKNLFILVLAIFWLDLLVQNGARMVPLSLGNLFWPAVPLGGLLLAASVAIAAIAGLLGWQAVARITSRMKQDELRKEKAQVQAEISTDQIRVLETKVQTLEKALEQALSGSTSRPH